MKDIFYKYDSINAFLKDIENGKVNKVFAGKECSQDVDRETVDFTGTESFAVADRLMKFGDDDNAAKMNAAAANVKTRAAGGTDFRPQMYTAQAGFMPCVPKSIMGLPCNMYNRKMVSFKNSKVLTIVYNQNALGGISSDEICKVSVNIVNAILAAEKSGYRINFYFLFNAQKGNERLTALIKIKDSGTYMDKRKMAYPLINPSMLRRHMFRFEETRSELKESRWANSYGSGVSDRETEKTLKDKHFKFDKMLSFYGARYLSSEQICKMFLK